MARKGRSKKCTVDGIEFDSMSEACLYCWCKEAEEIGIIESFTLQPHWELLDKVTYIKPKQLKTKVRYDERVLLNGCGYTADFSVTSKHLLGFPELTLDEMLGLPVKHIVDVKGERMHAGSSTNFSLIQKLMYKVHGIYVNKVVCGKFFAVNGMPRRLPDECYMKSDSSKLYSVWQKQFRGCKYIDEVWK